MRALILVDLYKFLPFKPLAKETKDNLIQAKYVKKILKSVGYKTTILGFSKSLDGQQIKDKYKLVFNLVETIDGKGNEIYLAPRFLENNNIPFTGGSSRAIEITTNKVKTKDILVEHNILTPGYIIESNFNNFKPGIYIFKPVAEDASVGIEESNIYYIKDSNIALEKIKELSKEGIDYFAEEYIDGREFNISIINIGGKPVVLPHAELIFKDFNNKYKIAGYKAKWLKDSFEYKNTYRSFYFPMSDNKLIEELTKITKAIWSIFGLRGYARVDYRIKDNIPYVLEINSNPCISPDSGFVAAAIKKGLTNKDMIFNIINDLNRPLNDF